MIWEHTGRMCWISRDMENVGYILEVKQVKGGWQLFMIDSTTGVTNASKYGHPLDAMRQGHIFKERYDTTKKEKKGGSPAEDARTDPRDCPEVSLGRMCRQL